MSALASAHRPAGLATGLREFDELTGGIRGGDVWLVTAGPQEGRSSLASQLALRSAIRARWPTWFVSPLEDSAFVAARMLATQAKILLDRILRGQVLDSEQPRLTAARQALEAAPLRAMTDHMLPDLDKLATFVSKHQHGLVVLDDVSDWAEDWPIWLGRLSVTGAAVVATVPHEVVVPRAPDSWQLNRTASQAAEVIVDVRTREITNWQVRPGEAELHVLQRRHGQVGRCDVVWQPYFGRFADMGSPGGNYDIAAAEHAGPPESDQRRQDR